jgi:hypothetical protein
MTGVQIHIQLPAEDPDLLRKYATVLDEHQPAVNPVYAERCRDNADELEANRAEAVTVASPIDLLASHGVHARVVTALKGQNITTVGQLCELDANMVGSINGIGFGKLRAQLCVVLAKFLMGLRPIPPK